MTGFHLVLSPYGDLSQEVPPKMFLLSPPVEATTGQGAGRQRGRGRVAGGLSKVVSDIPRKRRVVQGEAKGIKDIIQ